VIEKKILVPVGTSERSLKGVHHALALARRLGAIVYILQEARPQTGDMVDRTLEESLLDVINSGRQSGLTLHHYVATRDLKDEVVDMVREEGIDWLVFEADDDMARRLVVQLKPLVNRQIIQVREKTREGNMDERPGGGSKNDPPAGEKGGAMSHRLKIAVIDDEPIVGERLKAFLTRDGHQVESFVSPTEALDRLKEMDVDLVITDIRMADMDGIEVLEKVLDISPEIKVIMISGYATLDLARESLTKGAFDFIAKPFKLKEIRSTIKKAMASTDRSGSRHGRAASV